MRFCRSVLTASRTYAIIPAIVNIDLQENLSAILKKEEVVCMCSHLAKHAVALSPLMSK